MGILLFRIASVSTWASLTCVVDAGSASQAQNGLAEGVALRPDANPVVVSKMAGNKFLLQEMEMRNDYNYFMKTVLRAELERGVRQRR